jgi:hypothetical protein
VRQGIRGKEDGTHSEGDPVVSGEDDGLNGDIAYPDVAEDDGIIEWDFAGHWRRNGRRTLDGRKIHTLQGDEGDGEILDGRAHHGVRGEPEQQ